MKKSFMPLFKTIAIFLLMLSVLFGCKEKVIIPKEHTPNKEEFDKAMNQWDSDEGKPEAYALSAYAILKHRADVNDVLLTLGNVINILGLPTSFGSDAMYLTDDSWNIIGDDPRTLIIYNDKRTLINFSATGFVVSVLYEVKPEYHRGKGSFSWPQKIPINENPTIYTGAVQKIQNISELTDAAFQLARDNKTELDWYLIIVPPKYYISEKAIENYSIPCSAKVSFIDCLTKDIARAHYVIKGEHTLYYDQWLQSIDNKWQPIPAIEAHEIIIEKWKQ